jgi:hypothetical protein
MRQHCKPAFSKSLFNRFPRTHRIALLLVICEGENILNAKCFSHLLDLIINLIFTKAALDDDRFVPRRSRGRRKPGVRQTVHPHLQLITLPEY